MIRGFRLRQTSNISEVVDPMARVGARWDPVDGSDAESGLSY